MPKSKNNNTEEQKRITISIPVSDWKKLTLEAINKLASNSPSDMVQHLVDEHLKESDKK